MRNLLAYLLRGYCAKVQATMTAISVLLQREICWMAQRQQISLESDRFWTLHHMPGGWALQKPENSLLFWLAKIPSSNHHVSKLDISSIDMMHFDERCFELLMWKYNPNLSTNQSMTMCKGPCLSLVHLSKVWDLREEILRWPKCKNTSHWTWLR